MRIAMFTNTYLPHVGGVARSVSTYEEEFRRRGHDVRVIAPQFEGAEESTEFVLRIPAIQHFNGSDFSVQLPQPLLISDYLDEFQPQLIHSHHPFLLGDSALRAAWTRRLPLVFTHHTLYEQYTRYVPLDSEALQRVAIQMATEYCNLCTHVIAPSESIAELLVQRQVTQPISAIPTGIDLDRFGNGDGRRMRERYNIAADALVIGHVGRLAGEKNLAYLARAVGYFLAKHPDAYWLVVGSGEAAADIEQTVGELADAKQLVMAGSHTGQDLVDAYTAMDLFAFSSQSETQGMVLAEAMAARTPVVALDGPGVRDVLNDVTGRMLPANATEVTFADALREISHDRAALARRGDIARQSIRSFGLDVCADRILELYESLVAEHSQRPDADPGPWDRLLGRLEIEWNLFLEKTSALAAAVVETEATRSHLD
ncbi:glycosyltransferase [Lacipirellula sp.]|uniref:glycosyltransferase n=1 Tax=Lacipirellula sp. TaxID=2691419 RepID=UPI003D0F6F51